MRLTKKALKAINTKFIRPKLALALNISEVTMIRYISTNSENLTKAAALNVIKETTGLTDEEILETNTISELDVNE